MKKTIEINLNGGKAIIKNGSVYIEYDEDETAMDLWNNQLNIWLMDDNKTIDSKVIRISKRDKIQLAKSW